MKTRPLIRNAVVLGAGVMLALLLAAAGARSQTPPRLALPVDCQPGSTCFVQNYVDHDPSSTWRDYACGARSYDGHDGTDFRVPSMAAVRAGVAVLAAADGVVAGVRDGMKDVSIRETGKEAVKDRECGNGLVLRHADGWETQYCHLAQGSVSVRRGQTVRAGERLGRVGLSGLTEFPHLHLTVRHNGKAVDPFAPSPSAGACSSDATLWDDTAAAALVYRRRVMLNHGFSERVLSMAEVENQQPGEATPTSQSPALIAYVRMIGLEAGDTAHIVLRAPDGTVIAEKLLAGPGTCPGPDSDPDRAQAARRQLARRDLSRGVPGHQRRANRLQPAVFHAHGSGPTGPMNPRGETGHGWRTSARPGGRQAGRLTSPRPGRASSRLGQQDVDAGLARVRL
jgi:hypothetical protein